MSEDYMALVERIRGDHDSGFLIGWADVSPLADAVEALDREVNEWQARESNVYEVLREVQAQRDALQAQLDNMTTEERSTVVRINAKGNVDVGPVRHEQRLVGPWVEVTD